MSANDIREDLALVRAIETCFHGRHIEPQIYAGLESPDDWHIDRYVQRGGYDLILAGNLSTDGAGGVIPAMVAERLDLPQLTELSSVEVSGGTVRGTRTTDLGTTTLSAELPAVVSVTEAFPDARFPNFKGIMAAKKKPLETLSLADLGIDAEDYSVPRAIMTAAAERPAREAGVKIEDDGTAGAQLADFLVQNRLA